MSTIVLALSLYGTLLGATNGWPEVAVPCGVASVAAAAIRYGRSPIDPRRTP